MPIGLNFRDARKFKDFVIKANMQQLLNMRDMLSIEINGRYAKGRKEQR